MDVIQVGPIIHIECVCNSMVKFIEHFTVVFKYTSSVEDSIKLLCGTELYGLPIKIRKNLDFITMLCIEASEDYLKKTEQKNYFKLLEEAVEQPKEIKKSSNRRNNYRTSVLERSPTHHDSRNNKREYYKNSRSSSNNTKKPNKYQQYNNLKANNSKSFKRNRSNSNDITYNTRGNYYINADYRNKTYNKNINNSNSNRKQNFLKKDYYRRKKDDRYQDRRDLRDVNIRKHSQRYETESYSSNRISGRSNKRNSILNRVPRESNYDSQLYDKSNIRHQNRDEKNDDNRQCNPNSHGYRPAKQINAGHSKKGYSYVQ